VFLEVVLRDDEVGHGWNGRFGELPGGVESRSPSVPCKKKGVPVQTLSSTLVERVQAFVQNDDSPIEWGSPLLSTTPTPVAIRQLAVQLASAEQALREIALEVQKLASEVRDLSAQAGREV
jgi:hypothetical protein